MEHHFTLLGLQLKVKCEDVNNMLAGVHVFVDWTLPGVLPHFIFGVTRLQMDVMLQAPQGATIDMALMDAKVGYKFWRNGVEHAGTIDIGRKVEFGKYITKMAVHLKDTQIMEIVMETDHRNKVHGTCTVYGTSYEFLMNRVRGSSYIISTPSIPQIGLKSLSFVVNPNTSLKTVEIQTIVGKTTSNKIEIAYNPITTELGLYVTGDVNGAPLMCRFILAKDLKFAKAYISYNNVNYLMFNMEGRLARTGLIPTFLRYSISYDIMQGKWGEGEAKVSYDTLKMDRTLTISVVPKVGHAYHFKMKAKVEADEVEVSHELVHDRMIIYTAFHKLSRVENSAEKLMITYTEKCVIPSFSPLAELLEGTNLRVLLGNWKRNTMFTVDYTIKTGLQFGIYYKDSIMTNGKTYFNVLVDTMKRPYKLTLYYPVGPEIRGVNLGMKHLLGQDGINANIMPVVTNGKFEQLQVTTDLDNIKLVAKFPTVAASTTGSLVVTKSQTNEKVIEWTLYKDGVNYKVNMFTTVTTPNLPYICTERACKWTSTINYEVDLATKIAGLIPTHTLAVTLEKNAEPIFEVQQNVKTAPFFCRMSCPLVLPKPLSMTAEYVTGKQMVVRASDYLPGQIVMDITEPKYLIKFEADVNKKEPALATVHIDLALRQVRLAVAFIRTPLLEVSWSKETLMSNKITAVTVLPVLGKVMDLVVDYTVVTPLVVECRVNAGVRLPVFGVVEVDQVVNWELNKILIGSRMCSIKISPGNSGILSRMPEITSSTSLEYNIPSGSISGSIKSSVGSSNMEISAHNSNIYLMSNNVIV